MSRASGEEASREVTSQFLTVRLMTSFVDSHKTKGTCNVASPRLFVPVVGYKLILILFFLPQAITEQRHSAQDSLNGSVVMEEDLLHKIQKANPQVNEFQLLFAK